MSFTIRTVKKDDIPSLCHLMYELTGHEISFEDMENRLQFIDDSPFDFLYVCEDHDTILGLLGFRVRENLEEVSKYGEISVIVVDSAARRQGVGRFLMEFAENLAAEQGCIGTWLVSGFGREEQAHTFYKELGYEITGYRFVKRFK
jgi:GNAT superfamily N-acetyltransferase